MGGFGDSEWGREVGSVVLVELWTFGWVIGLPDPPSRRFVGKEVLLGPPSWRFARGGAETSDPPLSALRWKGGPSGTPPPGASREEMVVRPTLPLLGGSFPYPCWCLLSLDPPN